MGDESKANEGAQISQDDIWGDAVTVQTRCPHCGGVTGLEHRYISRESWSVTREDAQRMGVSE